MNKKILVLSMIATLSLGLISCGKSSNDEPTPTPAPNVNPPAPTPTPTPDPNNNNNGGNTNNSNTGNNSNNDGNSPASRSTADVAFYIGQGKTARVNNEVRTADANGLIELTGNYTSLTVESDDITEFVLRKDKPELRSLTIRSVAQSSGKTMTVNLSGAKNLTGLLLAGYTFDEVNLSNQSNLTDLRLGQGGRQEKETSFKKIILPTENNITTITARSPLTNEAIDLNNLPKLVKARFISPKFTKVSFEKSADLELISTGRQTGGQAFDVELKHNPKLKDITIVEATVPSFTVHNAPNLTAETNIQGVSVTNLDLTNVNADVVKTRILPNLNKGALRKAVLPGYGLVLGTAPLDGFTNLTAANTTLN